MEMNRVITINLLPAPMRRGWPLTRLFFLVSLLVFVFLLGNYVWGAYRLSALQQQLHEMHNQYALLLPAQKSMLLTQRKQETINNKNHVLNLLTKERKSWSAIMAHIGSITPVNVWIRDCSTGSGNSIEIKGTAVAYPDVSDLTRMLEDDMFFTKPILITVSNNEQAKSFELHVKLKDL